MSGDSIREARIKLLRTAIDGYLGADAALDALVGEAALMKQERDGYIERVDALVGEAAAKDEEIDTLKSSLWLTERAGVAAEREAAALREQLARIELDAPPTPEEWHKVLDERDALREALQAVYESDFFGRKGFPTNQVREALAVVSPAQPAEEQR